MPSTIKTDAKITTKFPETILAPETIEKLDIKGGHRAHERKPRTLTPAELARKRDQALLQPEVADALKEMARRVTEISSSEQQPTPTPRHGRPCSNYEIATFLSLHSMVRGQQQRLEYQEGYQEDFHKQVGVMYGTGCTSEIQENLASTFNKMRHVLDVQGKLLENSLYSFPSHELRWGKLYASAAQKTQKRVQDMTVRMINLVYGQLRLVKGQGESLNQLTNKQRAGCTSRTPDYQQDMLDEIYGLQYKQHLLLNDQEKLLNQYMRMMQHTGCISTTAEHGETSTAAATTRRSTDRVADLPASTRTPTPIFFLAQELCYPELVSSDTLKEVIDKTAQAEKKCRGYFRQNADKYAHEEAMICNQLEPIMNLEVQRLAELLPQWQSERRSERCDFSSQPCVIAVLRRGGREGIIANAIERVRIGMRIMKTVVTHCAGFRIENEESQYKEVESFLHWMRDQNRAMATGRLLKAPRRTPQALHQQQPPIFLPANGSGYGVANNHALLFINNSTNSSSNVSEPAAVAAGVMSVGTLLLLGIGGTTAVSGISYLFGYRSGKKTPSSSLNGQVDSAAAEEGTEQPMLPTLSNS